MSHSDPKTVADRETIRRDYARYVAAVMDASPAPVTTALEVFNTEVPADAGRAAMVQAILDNPLNLQGPLVQAAGPAQGRPLYIVHGADGECSWFLRHLRAADPARPVFGVNAPGWYGEATPGDWSELASRHVEHIVAHQPDGPYTLGGYSAGAYIALEMARLLQIRGSTVDTMFIVDPVFGNATMTLAELAGFRLHQLRQRRHPVMEPYFALADRLSLEDVLAQAKAAELPEDPIEKRLYRSLAIMAGLDQSPPPSHRGGLDAELVIFLTEHSMRVAGEPELAELAQLRARFIRGSEVITVDAPHIRLFEDPGLHRELATRLEEVP